MSMFVDQAPSPNLADFVDAIGELIPSIFRGHLCLAAWQVAAVDESNARHEKLIDSKRLELAV